MDIGGTTVCEGGTWYDIMSTPGLVVCWNYGRQFALFTVFFFLFPYSLSLSLFYFLTYRRSQIETEMQTISPERPRELII